METTLERAQEIFQNRATHQSQLVDTNLKLLKNTVSNISDFVINDHNNLLVTHGEKKLKLWSKIYTDINGEINLHKHAVSQICQASKVPAEYINRIIDTPWGIDLASTILQEHLQHFERKRSLVRMVRTETGDEIRGFLSDKYKRLETGRIFANLIQLMQKVNSKSFIYNCFVDDTRSWIDIMIPELFTITSEKNGTIYFVMGVRMSSSDFGDGAFQIQTYMINIVCNNGMTRETPIREIHLGKKLPDHIQFSDRTHMLDTELSISTMGDVIGQSFTNNSIARNLNQISKSTNIIIEPKNELAKLNTFTVDEKKLIIDELIANNPEHGVYGENSVWKLAQAMTYVGNTLSGRRQREIDEIAGNYINTKLN